MANERTKFFSSLFSEGRSRIILIVTCILLVMALVIGISVFKANSIAKGGASSDAQLGAAPTGISSVPGGFDRPETAQYAQLQEQQNTRSAQTAAQAGGSAIPTITSSSKFSSGNVPQCSQGGLDFTSLQQIQRGDVLLSSQPGAVGVLYADGTIHDAQGKLIGRLGSDGLARSDGSIAYDATGKQIGIVGPDGKVRDANGNIIGTVDADGVIRDATGKIIGRAGDHSQIGRPVYDANGKLIGYVGPDGKVRDANGNVIGTVDADGVVRDANGSIIGKVYKGFAGRPVYDANGKLIGYVGPDGKVRDANGKVIGTVSADGTVRDLNGKIIGKVGNGANIGKPVYDAQGRLIGYVGADGKVRDANGNVIGTVDADGMVHDDSGAVIGSVSKMALGANGSQPGTLAYGTDGQLLGSVGMDGKIRDANGNVIGMMGADGRVRDLNGKIIGRSSGISGGSTLGVTPSPASVSKVVPGSASIVAAPIASGPTAAASLPSDASVTGGVGGSKGLQEIVQQQNTLISDQKSDQARQQMQASISTQASQLFTAWSPPAQQYVAGADTSGAGGAAGAGGLGGTLAANAFAIVKAGTVMIATLDTAINSDEPGPVMATIVDGKFKGGKLLGKMVNQGQKVMLTFDTVSMPNSDHSFQVNTVAIDPDTARTAISSETDNHYLLRYGTLFAAQFISGYGQALSQAGATITTNLFNTTTSMPPLSGGDKALVALGNVGTSYSAMLTPIFNEPPTVKVHAGTSLGILFLADVQGSGVSGMGVSTK